MQVLEADKIGSATSPLKLTKIGSVISENNQPKVGDVVIVRTLGESVTYGNLELPSGRLAKINAGDVLLGVLGKRRALKGFVGDVPDAVKTGDKLHLLNMGGVIGVCKGHHSSLSDAIQVETPGVTILQAAHRALESITLDREVGRLRDSLSTKFAESIYYGFWFAPEFEILRSMIEQTQETVSGDVRLKLYKGNVTILGRRSPYSLYKERVVTFEDDAGAYDQHDAEGFIKLQALRLRLRQMD